MVEAVVEETEGEEAVTMIELLQRLEWSAQLWASQFAPSPGCPICRGFKESAGPFTTPGHKDGCELAAAIRKLLGERP